MVDNNRPQDARDQLSERELAVLRLMADGLSNREIADRLFLALTTIKWYIRQINAKLDTHSRTQTVARAHQLKLIGDREMVRVVLIEDTKLPENLDKGLCAFADVDAADCSGRETLARPLVESLVQSTFLAVVGPSVVNPSLIFSVAPGPRAECDYPVAHLRPAGHSVIAFRLSQKVFRPALAWFGRRLVAVGQAMQQPVELAAGEEASTQRI